LAALKADLKAELRDELLGESAAWAMTARLNFSIKNSHKLRQI
jgi:hypothetical protein